MTNEGDRWAYRPSHTPRRKVLKPLRCIKIGCDALRCIFQHVGSFAADGGISQLFIVRSSNSFQYDNEHLMSFLIICDSNFSVRYFWLPSQLWVSQESADTFRSTGHTAAIVLEKLAMFCNVLRCSVMLLEAQNRRKMAHFIASCGRALWWMSDGL